MYLSPQSFCEMLFSVVQTSTYYKNLLRLNAASESSFLVPWILDIFNFEDDSFDRDGENFKDVYIKINQHRFSKEMPSAHQNEEGMPQT